MQKLNYKIDFLIFRMYTILPATYKRFLKNTGDYAITGCKPRETQIHNKANRKKTRIQTKRPSDQFKAQESIQHYSSRSWIKFPCFTALELIYMVRNSRVNLQSHSSFVT